MIVHFDLLFNMGERGPGKPPAGVLRVAPPQPARFGSPQTNGSMKNPMIGTYNHGGKLALGRRKV